MKIDFDLPKRHLDKVNQVEKFPKKSTFTQKMQEILERFVC